jgi:H+-transporting ATPase
MPLSPSGTHAQPPKDALDTMCLGAVDLPSLDVYTMLDHQPFDPTIKRTESVRPGGALLHLPRGLSNGLGLPPGVLPHPFPPPLCTPPQTIRGPDGKEFRVTKGAPQVIAKLCGAENNPDLKMRVEAEVANLGSRGIRSLAVARTFDDAMEQWEMLGMLTFLDPPRPDTKHTIEQVGAAAPEPRPAHSFHRESRLLASSARPPACFRPSCLQALEYGVDVKMITGDQVLIAKEMSRILGLGLNIPDATGLPKLDEEGKIPKDLHKYTRAIVEADGFAQVYPEHKVRCWWENGVYVCVWGGGGGPRVCKSLAKLCGAVHGCGVCQGAAAAAAPTISPPPLPAVPHRGVPAPGRLCRGHDGRRRERRPRPEEGRRRHCGGGGHRRRPRRRRHRAHRPRLVGGHPRHHHRPPDLPARQELHQL